MIKAISLLILSSVYLFGVSFWTLTGLSKTNIYVSNNVAYLNVETVATTKEKMTTTLHNLGLTTEEQDGATLMFTFSEIENEDEHYVYVQIALGEEVQTFRTNKDHTYAITYSVSDFIEVDVEELDNDILESVDFLLSQFSEQYEDDKE